MNRKLLTIVAVVVLVAIATLLLMTLAGRRPASAPLVQTNFIGFTNTPAGPLALVAIHFRPGFGGCHWPSFEISHKYRGGDWERWGPPPGDPRADFRMINAQLSAFAVANTNDAWRFVMEVKENLPLKWSLISRARTWWNRWRKIPPPGPSLSPFNGSHYFLTNETSDRK